MNCNYQSLEIEKCFAGVEEKQSQKKNSYFTNN